MTGDFTPWYTDGRKSHLGWVEDANGCHIWTGALCRGYAKAMVGARSDPLRAPKPVYRLRYEREIGPIPDGMDLDHFKCDNGAGGCCNPHHCRPVTPRENLLRSGSISARNRAKTHCPAGHLLAGDNLDPWTARSGYRKCRTCMRVQAAKWRADHHDRVCARKHAAYRKAHPFVKIRGRRDREDASRAA